MRSGKKVIYWDTCIFLTWFIGKSNISGVIEGIEEIVRLIDKNEAILITSVMTETEILRGNLSPSVIQMFDKILKRRNVKMISHDQRIARKSSQIMEYYQKKGQTLTHPDCVHLATAILYEADEFLTLDGSGKKKKLLSLSGDEGVDGLVISIPLSASRQGNLLSGVPALDADKGP
jgi:hypothetical protein